MMSNTIVADRLCSQGYYNKIPLHLVNADSILQLVHIKNTHDKWDLGHEKVEFWSNQLLRTLCRVRGVGMKEVVETWGWIF